MKKQYIANQKPPGEIGIDLFILPRVTQTVGKPLLHE